MKIAIRGGHNYGVTGANGVVNEVAEDRKIYPEVIEWLTIDGNEVLDVTPNKTSTSAEDLSYGVDKANEWGADYFASIHLNAGGGVGTEALYQSANGQIIAGRISASVASLGFTNRGAKPNTRGLYELKYTNMVANIVECFFCDSQSDVALYNSVGVSMLAKKIAEGMVGHEIKKPEPVVEAPKPSVMYRVILDGVQKYALSDQAKAEADVKSAVDAGQAKEGKVQRNTDGVDLFLYPPKVVSKDYEVELCRIIVDGVNKIALTGKTKCINYAKSTFVGHVKVQCVSDSVIVAEFDIAPPTPPVVEPPVVEPVPEPQKPVVHPIMGVAEVEVGQAETYLHKVNPDAPFYAQIYKEEGELEGVRWDIAFAQSIKETNWFRFGGDVLAEQNNFAGIGTVGGGVRGNYFPDARIGIKAQIQHLKAYASTEALKGECIDPRFKYVSRGIAPNIEDLGSGKWASDTDNYGGKIWLAVEAMRTTITDPNCKPTEPKPPVITPPVVEPEPETPATPEEPKVEEPKKNWLLELFKMIVKAIIEYFEGKKE
jgi:N-acetylmuramoyl-L-alanine amidase